MSRHIRTATAFLMLLVVMGLGLPPGAAAESPPPAPLPFDDPLFDHAAIAADPLDLVVTSEKTGDGVIVRHLEFTDEVRPDESGEAKPVRVRGILLLPEQGDSLPGLLWCQGGMAPAGTGIPGIYARKGYACINITLPHDRSYTWSAWDAQNPRAANMTRYAHMQMRAITVLCRTQRVDAARIGVAGASYGGFFSTLVAGADPRVKAGTSFFTAGHHDMGTNLPQFNLMPDRAAVDTWMRTIDPAWRLRERDVPFMWTLPTNDNWFYFPAVTRTYEEARTTRKILAIVPYWTHGFPPNVDQQIFDWFDIHLKGTRDPYIQPGPLGLTQTDAGLEATWSSDGRPMKRAELVVSPNAPAADQSPWLGQWVHRLHQPFPATLSDDGRTARAVVPVLDPTRPMLVYGNVYDAHDVVTSTRPVLLAPPYAPTPQPRSDIRWNGCPWGELEPDDVALLTALAQSPGESDATVAHRGRGSVRVAAPPPAAAGARPKPARLPQIKLFHVPHLAHRLEVAVRAELPVKVQVTVQALPPANWQNPAVKAVMGTQPPALDKPAAAAQATVDAGPEWQLVALDVPAPGKAIEGYNLELRPAEPSQTTWWYDSISFTPVGR